MGMQEECCGMQNTLVIPQRVRLLPQQNRYLVPLGLWKP